MNRALAELLAVIALGLLGAAAWIHHDRAREAIGIARQVAADRQAAAHEAAALAAQEATHAAKVAEVHRDHEAELVTIANAYSDALGRVRALAPHGMPGAAIASGAGAVPTAAGLPARADRSPGPGEDCHGLPEDLGLALDLYSRRLATLNADARELDADTH